MGIHLRSRSSKNLMPFCLSEERHDSREQQSCHKQDPNTNCVNSSLAYLIKCYADMVECIDWKDEKRQNYYHGQGAD
jgi:hypothetical protein